MATTTQPCNMTYPNNIGTFWALWVRQRSILAKVTIVWRGCLSGALVSFVGI